MTEIPHEEFYDIIQELERLPISTNNYRVKTGNGRSQTFGLVNRRCLPPDYSRNNWRRAYLYHLLLEFADKYVDISYNAITVNQNFRAGKHYDQHNTGLSYIVAFGGYTGGDLLIHEGDLSGNHSIWCKPIKADFSKILHSVDFFTGDRYSLVFYTLINNKMPESIPPPSVKYEDGKWHFYRGTERTTGLPHPFTNRTRKEIIKTAKEKKKRNAATFTLSFK